MKTKIPTGDLNAAGWNHYASDWYYYSPTWGSTTHIHIGGNNTGGNLNLKFVSIKVKDSVVGRIYSEGGWPNWSLLEDTTKVPYDVAIEFRKALGNIGLC